MKYIALLRGINVGGKNRLNMPALTEAFEEMGFSKVKTYLQSGNVVFECDEGDYDSRVTEAEKPVNNELSEAVEMDIEEKIEGKILGKFGLAIRVIVRTSQELGQIVSRNPFLLQKAI
ncbi:MAG: DUF1697 domain-containing protein [Clostridiales bacterium]|nr:DUF1697 domain-containing protein [Clostridiales bacterium]